MELYLRPHHLATIEQLRTKLEIYPLETLFQIWIEDYPNPDFIKNIFDLTKKLTPDTKVTLTPTPLKDSFCSLGCPFIDYCVLQEPEQWRAALNKLYVQFGTDIPAYEKRKKKEWGIKEDGPLTPPDLFQFDQLSLAELNSWGRQGIKMEGTYQLQDLIIL